MAARHKRKLRQVLGQLLDETVRPRSQVGFCHLHVQFVDNLNQRSPSRFSSIWLLLLVQIASWKFKKIHRLLEYFTILFGLSRNKWQAVEKVTAGGLKSLSKFPLSTQF